jgi:hypothetical protein
LNSFFLDNIGSFILHEISFDERQDIGQFCEIPFRLHNSKNQAAK